MKSLLSLPNAITIENGQGRVFAYTKANNPVEFDYRPHTDVKEWITKTSFEYDRGQVVGVITEPGPLTLALKEGRSVLIHDLDRCEDPSIFEMIMEEMITYEEVVFAFAVCPPLNLR